MKRREMIKHSLLSSAVLGGQLMLPSIPQAFLPAFFLRFLFSRGAVRTLGFASRRAVSKVAVRRGTSLKRLRGRIPTSKSGYPKPRKMLPVKPLAEAGVDIGGFSLLAPELFKLTIEFNVNKIWIIDDAKPDPFYVTCRNDSNDTVSDDLFIDYKSSGLISKDPLTYDHGRLTLKPGEREKISLYAPEDLTGFRVVNFNARLPNTFGNVVLETSENVLMASSWEVA